MKLVVFSLVRSSTGGDADARAGPGLRPGVSLRGALRLPGGDYGLRHRGPPWSTESTSSTDRDPSLGKPGLDGVKGLTPPGSDSRL